MFLCSAAREEGIEELKEYLKGRTTVVAGPSGVGKSSLTNLFQDEVCMETGEIIRSVVGEIEPAAVIAIDALAARSLSRLGCTIQLADCGIAPGSGVANRRKELSQETLGVPVISMGIPTVVDGETLAFDLLYRPEGTSEESMEQLRQMFQPQGRSMMVTPREVDQMVERGAKLISMAINLALQPDLSAEEITYLLA